AEVSCEPCAKRAIGFSWKVNVFASVLAVHDWTRSGIGCARSLPLYVKRVSKIARSTIDAVGSNARCGSDVLIVNELSTTSVGAADERVVAPYAASAHTSASIAESGSSETARRTGDGLKTGLLFSGGDSSL